MQEYAPYTVRYKVQRETVWPAQTQSPTSTKPICMSYLAASDRASESESERERFKACHRTVPYLHVVTEVSIFRWRTLLCCNVWFPIHPDVVLYVKRCQKVFRKNMG